MAANWRVDAAEISRVTTLVAARERTRGNWTKIHAGKLTDADTLCQYVIRRIEYYIH